MFKVDQIPEILVRRFQVEFSAGECLFKQGTRGNNMYILLSGTVQISHRLGAIERLVGILIPGEVLGEKAICSNGTYKRSFTALARSDVSALELGMNDVKMLREHIPDFGVRMLEIVSHRLDKANHLVSILQLHSPSDRLIHFLVYYAIHFGKTVPRGRSIQVTCRMVSDNANVDDTFVNTCIQILVDNKLILKDLNGYIIPDENQLLGFCANLKERVAA